MDVGLMMIFASYGWDNIADEKAEASLRLFAREVLPVLKSWQSPVAKAAE
jgi:hypothetical protein